MAGLFLEFLNEGFRKARISEGLERLGGQNAHHFPVTRHCVFAIAGFSHSHAEGMGMIVDGFDAWDVGEFADTEAFHHWNIKSTHRLGRVDPGISSDIAELGGVGFLTNAG